MMAHGSDSKNITSNNRINEHFCFNFLGQLTRLIFLFFQGIMPLTFVSGAVDSWLNDRVEVCSRSDSMKQHARFLMGAATSLAVAWTVAVSGQADQGQARVQSIRAGSASYSVDGKTWNAVQVGTVLKQGAKIKTDGAGVVDLYLGKNGPLVRLAPSTTLGLTTLEIRKGAGETVVTTLLDLPQGKIHALVRRLNAASKFEIKTPTALCGVRGTRITATSRGEFTVLEGRGYVLYTPPGKTKANRFEVRAGFTFEPTLNNNEGGVIETLPSLANELRSATSQMMGYLPEFERVRAWTPTPSWNMPGRPFVAPGGGQAQGGDPSFVLPPVTEPGSQPTSPVQPQGK